MRKLMVVFLAMVMTVSFAGVSLADDVNVSVENDVTNTNTATATSSANSNATGGNATLLNNEVNPIQPFNAGAPGALNPGQAIPNSPWMFYTPIALDCLTYEESVDMSDDFFWNRIEVTLKKKGLAATSSIRILDYYGRKSGDTVVGFARVFGKKKDITEALIALAAKEGMEKGATGMGIMLRVKNRVNAKGLSVGTGAGAGLYIPCNSGVGTGMTFGAYLSSTAVEDEIELTIIYLVVCLEKPCPPPAPCPPPPAPPEVKKPCPPQEPPCDLTKIWERIHELEREVQKCTRYCFNNLKLRYALEKEYIELYVCTKEKRYLDSAIYHAEVAERNYRKGYDIAAHRAEADQVISEVWYLQAGAINLTRGGSVADNFAASKKLERYPKEFAR